MRTYTFPLLALIACFSVSPAEILKRGLHAAAAGDPGAWNICLAGRGTER